MLAQHLPNLDKIAIPAKVSPSTFLETYLLTCLLHDIGTAPQNMQNTRLSFEWQGAMLALDLLKSNGAPVAQAESVAEAIIRHQDLGESGMTTAVGALVILTTVFGMLCSSVLEGTIVGGLLTCW